MYKFMKRNTKTNNEKSWNRPPQTMLNNRHLDGPRILCRVKRSREFPPTVFLEEKGGGVSVLNFLRRVYYRRLRRYDVSQRDD